MMKGSEDVLFDNLPPGFRRMPSSSNIEDRRIATVGPQRPVTPTPTPTADYPDSPLGGKTPDIWSEGMWPSEFAGDLSWARFQMPSTGPYANSLYPGPYRPYNPSPPHPAPPQAQPDVSDLGRIPRPDPSIGRGLMNLWHAYWNGTL